MTIARRAISLGVSALIVIIIILIVGFGILLNATFNTTTTASISSSTSFSTLVSNSSFATTQSSNATLSSSSISTASTLVTAQTTNSTLGLELSVSVNSTSVPSEDAIQVSGSITNTLSTVNNLTAANDWPIQGPAGLLALLSGPCDLGNGTNKLYSPIGFGVFAGFYGLNNISSAGNPLPIWAFITCPADFAFNGSSLIGLLQNITSYSFLPKSDSGYYSAYYSGSEGLAKGVLQATIADSATVSASNSTGTLPPPYDTLGSSLPQNYTLVAGDEWGQIVLLQFTVTPSNNLPVFGEFLSSLALEGCSEGGVPIPCISFQFAGAILFNCALEAATSSGCIEHLSSDLGNYTITTWYPYVDQANEPTSANCWFSESGYATPPYGYCFLINSTAFVYSVV